MEADRANFNLPDEDVDEIATKIGNEWAHPLLTSDQLYIVGYSMGGLVTRSLLLNHKKIKADGVLFVASPLSGESMEL